MNAGLRITDMKMQSKFVFLLALCTYLVHDFKSNNLSILQAKELLFS